MTAHAEAVSSLHGKLRVTTRNLASLLLGPSIGALLWFAPLPLALPAHHAIAIVVFMVVYWIARPIDHGLTALAGCYLFWTLHVVKFSVAFGGFADSTPWFMFGAMLMGDAAARSGLARRIGYLVMRSLGVSYPKLLLSIIFLVCILNFLVPSGMAQLAIVAPIVIGVVAAFGLEPLSNVGRGMFIVLSYTCGLFNKMILAGGASILTAGIVRRIAGINLYWTLFLIAYLPAILLTILVCWGLILWLYPPEKPDLPGGRQFLCEALDKMGSWNAAEKRTLFWLGLAIVLWATDKLHHIRPDIIALGIGLVLVLPKIGVLGTRAIREMNALLIIFLGGVLSMGDVLVHTKALDTLSSIMMGWMTPLLGSSIYSAPILYGTAFAYHFLLGSELSMLSTSLPVLIRFAQTHGFNPVAFAMVWNFASGGKLFVYQSSVLILGYSYGYFEAKDLLRVGVWLTIVEGLILFVLVPFYWPLIGLHWLR